MPGSGDHQRRRRAAEVLDHGPAGLLEAPLPTLAVALALSAGIYALRDALPNPNEGVTLLYAAPIAMVAIRFGALGGIAAACVATGLFAVWEQTNADVSIGALGYATRAAAFLVVGGLVGAFAADRRRLVVTLRELAQTDPLTRVLNHASFYVEVRRELAAARRYGRQGALLVADLDNFKDVNDTYGHTVGDTLLKGAADAVRRALRDIDVVGRIGGDEFAVLLPQTDRAGAALARRRITTLLSAIEHDVADGAVRLSASIGITTFDGSSNATADDLLSAADRDMYDVKARRRRQAQPEAESAVGT